MPSPVTRLAVADVDGDGRAEVFATGIRSGDRTDAGVLELYSGDGRQLFSRYLAAWPLDAVIADLEGDGTPELIIAAMASDGECSVRALNPRGVERWRTPIANCELPRIAVADVDGDGKPEIGYGDVTIIGMPHVALLRHDGSVRWKEETKDDTSWVALVPGGLLHAGAHGEDQGHVTLRGAAGGTVRWSAKLPSLPNPEVPLAPFSGEVSSGALMPDANDDGVPELAVISFSGAVRLLDGATGLQQWKTDTVAADTAPGQRPSSGGQLAWVPGSTSAPGFLAVGLRHETRARVDALALSEAGQRLTSFGMEGESHAVVAARLGEHRRGAAIAGGLNVHAVVAAPRP
ncbi:MAG: hypothetical protein ACK4N5_16235 [Myxococcales bacterium]